MSTVTRDRWLAVNFAATIFVSAFLLFQVQPLVSKCILPWFGGTPAVWTTCMLFFQTLLFVGYAYAHFSAQYLRPKFQAMVHLVLIVLALVFLRVVPSNAWKPPDSTEPALRILVLLAASVGLPYFVLSSTGPLLQAWFARSFENRIPYRLYALSNVGSLLALLSYPFFFERKFDIENQATIWMGGFVVYAALCGYAAMSLWMAFGRVQSSGFGVQKPSAEPRPSGSGIPVEPRPVVAQGSEKSPSPEEIARPSLLRILLWLILPAFASVALLATTNHICADVSVSPFLWILPLSLYLVTFIVAFDHPRWYRPLGTAVFAIVAIYCVGAVYNAKQGKVVLYEVGTPGQIMGQIAHLFSPTKTVAQEAPKLKPVVFHVDFKTNLALNCLALLGICMMCHGELVLLRPDPKYLTGFYLMIAAGGALGGIAVGLVAPNVFDWFLEWNLSLMGGYLLAVVLICRAVWQSTQPVSETSRGQQFLSDVLTMVTVKVPFVRVIRKIFCDKRFAPIIAAISLPIAGIGMFDLFGYLKPPPVEMRARNFFGTLAVKLENDGDSNDPANPLTPRDYELYNGRITHGLQFIDPDRRRIPTTYYAPSSGVGMAIGYYRQELKDRGIRIGAVGLGTGTLAAYVDKDDSICFYEINPKVREITTSGKWFTYLKDAEELGGHVEIKMGDARLSMERENDAGNPPRYDVLVLDAFSGDAIPVHLLTLDAMNIYLQHLTNEKQDGIDGCVAVHISNLHVDLEPVVLALAKELNLEHEYISNDSDYSVERYNSDWIILTRNKDLAEYLSKFSEKAPEDRDPPETKPQVLWTDGFSNLFDVLR